MTGGFHLPQKHRAEHAGAKQTYDPEGLLIH